MSHEGGVNRILAMARSHRMWQTLGVYLVASWVALQVVDFLAQNFGLPDWFPAFAVALLVIGLPIVLATAIVQSGPVTQRAAEADQDSMDATGASDRVAPDRGAPQSVHQPVATPAHHVFTWRNAILGGMGAFALWGVVAAIWLVIWSGRSAMAGDDADRALEALRTVAVLPFDNLSTDQDNAFFADGVHEDVLTQLSKIEALTVISRTSVLGYRETTRNLSDIAAELGAGSVVEGSVRRSGDNVRITAQLIDASSDEHLWADNFDRALTAANVFSIQTEIAQRIAEALAATLTPEEASRIEHQPTEDLVAYDATLRGRERYRLYTEDGNNEAIRLFRTSTERDPEFAEPWAGLADAYGQRVIRYGYGPEWADSAEAAARHAIQLDGELSSAYKALGLALLAGGDLDAALEANHRAVEHAPNNADAINNIGATYARLGRLADDVRWTKRSFQLQPNLAFTRSNLSYSYMRLREYAIAERLLADAMALDPSSSATLAAMSRLRWFTGEHEEAVRLAERLVGVDPNDLERIATAAAQLSYLGEDERALELAQRGLELAPEQGVLGLMHVDLVAGRSLARLGRLEDALPYLERDLARNLERSVVSGPENIFRIYLRSVTHAAMGQWDDALDSLAQASRVGFASVLLLELDPIWDPVREDPRFVAMLVDMNERVDQARIEIEREEIAAGGRP